MGLDLDHVISQSWHHGAFICTICQHLTDLDCIITAGCSSRCFCKQCLQKRLDANKTTCPTCNQDLLYSNKNNHENNDIQLHKKLHLDYFCFVFLYFRCRWYTICLSFPPEGRATSRYGHRNIIPNISFS